MFIIELMMLILCIAGVERVAVMKKLNLEEAVKVLEDMKVKIAIPKAAELQRKRNEAIDMAIEALNNSEIPNSSDSVPSAEPERKTGRWIPHQSKYGKDDECVYTCDICGENIGFVKKNYCPNCGCIMM